MEDTHPPTCDKCGALIGDERKHAQWHNRGIGKEAVEANNRRKPAHPRSSIRRNG